MWEIRVLRVQIRSLHPRMGTESLKQSENPHIRAQIIQKQQPIICKPHRKETTLLLHWVQPFRRPRGKECLWILSIRSCHWKKFINWVFPNSHWLSQKVKFWVKSQEIYCEADQFQKDCWKPSQSSCSKTFWNENIKIWRWWNQNFHWGT